MKNELWILSGYPFAGKSTLARGIAERTGCEIVSFDQVRKTNMFVPKNGEKTKQWELIETYSYGRDVAIALENGNSVVYDGVSPTHDSRQHYKAIADKHSAVPIVVYVNTPRDVIFRRWQQNREHPIRPDVALQTFNRISFSFEEPTPEEQPIVLSSEKETAKWLEELPGSVEQIKIKQTTGRIMRSLERYQTDLIDFRDIDPMIVGCIARQMITSECKFVYGYTLSKGKLSRILCRELLRGEFHLPYYESVDLVSTSDTVKRNSDNARLENNKHDNKFDLTYDSVPMILSQALAGADLTKGFVQHRPHFIPFRDVLVM